MSATRSVNGECTESGPPVPGCPALFENYENPDYMAFTADGDNLAEIGSGASSASLWYGQDPATLSGPYSCPLYIPLAFNAVYIPAEQEFAVWKVYGLRRVADRGIVGGLPQAEYELPDRQFISVSPQGKYVMQGGRMVGRCEYKVGQTNAGSVLYLGKMYWSDYTGNVWYASGTGGTNGSNADGWAYEDTFTGNVTGMGNIDDFAGVVSVFHTSGHCTEGLEVWIDGVQKCNGDGTLH